MKLSREWTKIIAFLIAAFMFAVGLIVGQQYTIKHQSISQDNNYYYVEIDGEEYYYTK